jgi:glycosyltransferase involved in cell wall biosynthesis
MRISAVIPLYNKERSISRAIKSVLNQTKQIFEIIVINDGSTDNSSKRVSQLSEKSDLIRMIHQENAGVSAARNRGVQEARSDIIAFLDADDEWYPTFIEEIIALSKEFSKGDVFCTSYIIQEINGRKTKPETVLVFEPNYRGYIANYLDVIRKVLPFNVSSFVVTKKALNQIGGFPVGVIYGEDVDTFVRLSLHHKIVFVNKVLSIYHRDAENRACDRYNQYLKEYYPVKNLSLMLEKGLVPSHFMQSAIEYVAKNQLSLAQAHLHFGNPQHARGLIRSCKGTRIYRDQWYYLYLCSFIPPVILRNLIQIRNKLTGQKNDV